MKGFINSICHVFVISQTFWCDVNVLAVTDCVIANVLLRTQNDVLHKLSQSCCMRIWLIIVQLTGNVIDAVQKHSVVRKWKNM